MQLYHVKHAELNSFILLRRSFFFLSFFFLDKTGG